MPFCNLFTDQLLYYLQIISGFSIIQLTEQLKWFL